MKVRVNHLYRFDPVLLDQFDARTSLKKGDVVRVVNLPGCPRANTMGHCYVATAEGEFIGLVCCNSLEPVIRQSHVLRISNAAKAILAGVDAGDVSLTAARDAMDSLALSPVKSIRIEAL